MSTPVVDPFAALRLGRFMCVVSYRRNGEGVPTPVEHHFIGDRLLFVTDRHSGKMKRIRRDPLITVAPCNIRGHVNGEVHFATARILGTDEADDVAFRLSRTHPLQWFVATVGRFVRGRSAEFVEVMPAPRMDP